MTSPNLSRQQSLSSRAAYALAPVGWGRFKTLALVGCATLALAGCRELVDNKPLAKDWTIVDFKERHPILVTEKPTSLSLHVSRGSHGLSYAQRARVISFANRAQASGASNSRIKIKAPSGSSNEVAALRAVHEIRKLIGDQGFNGTNISVEAYHKPGHHHPPVRLSHVRYTVEGPECGIWNKNVGYEPRNLSYPDFGCANQRNFAAQIANPADLVTPRTQTPRPNGVRFDRFGKYVRGESTATQRTADERANTTDDN